MKPIKIILLLFAVILNFGSCKTTQLRNMHNREIRTELEKFSDVLDLKRTKIHFNGKFYYMRGGAPNIYLSLYLKPDYNNHETLFAIRDDLIDFFSNDLGPRYFPSSIAIIFTLGETGSFYSIVHRRDIWYERWTSDLFNDPSPNVVSEEGLAQRFGRPIMGKTIEELDTLLHKYINSSDIERFDSYHSGTDFIRVWLIIPYDFDRKTVLAIRDVLVAFFEKNQLELTEEYGSFNRIQIMFYRMTPYSWRPGRGREIEEGISPRYVCAMIYQSNKWEWRTNQWD